MGCVFCASGLNGVARNLTAGEILEQLVRLRNLLPAPERLDTRRRHGHGRAAGQPRRLLEALEVATRADGLGIGARHITISTVGLPAKIRRLADLGKQYHLAVSLHAPNDALRTRIVPTNDKTGLAAILAAADYFFEKTGRQVTYEYVLLRDLNDRAGARGRAGPPAPRPAGARQPDSVQRRGGAALSPAEREALTRLRSPTCKQDGLSVKVRKRKGSDIDAACGQLRRSTLELLAASLRERLPELAEARG